MAVREARALAAVERACTEATSADALFENLSDVLHETIPHDASTLFGVDPLTMLATSPSRVENLDDTYCDTYWHLEFHEHDTGLFVDLAKGERVTAMRLALGDSPGKSIRYRDFMAPQGYEDELRGVFQKGQSTWGMVGLYREGGTAFDEDDVRLLEAMSAPVADALRVHVREQNPWLEQTNAPGLIVLDDDGNTISANAEAEYWLRELWPLSMHGRDFDLSNLFARRTMCHDVPTPLFALFSRARAVAAGRDTHPTRVRVRDRRGRWLVIHATALKGPNDPRNNVAVVIEAAKSSEIAPIIIDAYSLTPRERDVLSAIARGGSTAEIAAQLYLSPHTVRDHIKTVFEKFGVSSRNELVARLYGEHYAEPFHESMVHVG